jgi:membrane protease YdiL (CAAX protease family)
MAPSDCGGRAPAPPRAGAVGTDATVDASPAPIARSIASAWLAGAALAAIVVPVAVGAAIPVLTLVLLLVASLVLRRGGSAAVLGLVRIPRTEMARVTIVATIAMTAFFGLAEFLGHPYRELLDLVRVEPTPDSTFAWVVDHPGPVGLAGFVLHGGLVTMFAEEVVFRGALLQRLRLRGAPVSVGVSTAAFAAVQTLPALLLPVSAGLSFLLLDAVVAVGMIGGLAAHRTGSILPPLVAVTVANVAVLAAVA